LTGAGMLHQIPLWITNPDKPVNVGHNLIAVNIEHFLPLAEFYERVRWMSDQLRSAPPAQAGGRILLPGELEDENAARRSDGLDLPEPVYADLYRLGEEWGVDPRALRGPVLRQEPV